MEKILLIVMGNQLYPNHKVGMREGLGAEFVSGSGDEAGRSRGGSNAGRSSGSGDEAGSSRGGSNAGRSSGSGTEARSDGHGRDGEGPARPQSRRKKRGSYTPLGPAPMPIFMAEDMGLCTRFRYHRHKLLLILSAMRSHYDFLQGRHTVYYYQIDDKRSYFEKLRDAVQKSGAEALSAYEPDNFWLQARLEEYADRLGVPLYFRPSKSFLLTGDEVQAEVDPQDAGTKSARNRPRLQSFYINRRKKMDILMEEGSPTGGQWSFDRENRKPFPKEIKFLPLPKADWTKHTHDLAPLIRRLFPENPGDLADFFLPTTRAQALKWLDSFLQYRLPQFGPYEDAIHKSEVLGFHSLLSPIMNIGLLFPAEVVDAVCARDVPLASKEGFVRQIIGWREFIRGIYLTWNVEGNFFEHRRKLGPAWYSGSTGIPVLDDSIKKVLRYGYVHHIERLMVIGNIMLLSEIHPDEVYRWFSELFVDAYDWVMVPNVYGMSQYADGGSFATKPYVASSRYLMKMSNYSKGKWCDTVDGLFWRFVKMHRSVFEKNPRMKMMTSWLDKMDAERFRMLQNAADSFIEHTTV